MLIKTKFIIVATISLIATIMIGFILLQNTSTIGREIEKQIIISEIKDKIFEGTILRDDYLLHREERPLIQLKETANALDKLLARASEIFMSADEQITIGNIVDNKKSIDQALFVIIAKPSGGLEQQLISQILVKSQDNITIASRLENVSRNSVTNNQQRTIFFVLILIAVISLIIIIALYFIWRSIGKPLLALKEAAVRIATLDFSTTTTTTTTTGGGELGELGRVFNVMMGKLKEAYVSLKNANTATQNVLEDLNVEKSKYETLAKDLEKFKLALDNTSEQVVIADPEGNVIYVNPATEKITGYTPEETIGKKSGVLWKKPMPPEYYQKLWDTIEKQKKVFTGEIQNRRKNGEIYTAVISISPIFDKNGEIIYFVSVERDITQEKEIDKAKTEFISLASHQLRTPLTAISWYTEMLLKGDMGKIISGQKKYLKQIYEGDQRMIKLVNTLLDVSRLELGTLTTKSEPLKLKEVAESVLVELKPLIVTKKLTLDTHYDPSLPIISADPQSTRMILQNLLGNAVKYTEVNGKIRFDISVQGSNILIKVWNDGTMISKESQPKIFTKLFRDNWAKEKDPDGNGLGLYIVKSIVEKSGGKVWFESEESKGTTFYVTFPIIINT